MSWEYIAGFFDGEGNVRLEMGGGRNAVQAQIIQAGPGGLLILTAIAKFLAAYGIESKIHHRSARYTNRLPVHVLYTGSGSAERFLGRVLPYIHVKKLQAQDVLRFRKIFPPGSGGVVGDQRMIERRCKIDESVRIWL